eukprot:scaffold8058_cov258-Pinguiococcus_pyrenoidosus.AAC.5
MERKHSRGRALCGQRLRPFRIGLRQRPSRSRISARLLSVSRRCDRSYWSRPLAKPCAEAKIFVHLVVRHGWPRRVRIEPRSFTQLHELLKYLVLARRSRAHRPVREERPLVEGRLPSTQRILRGALVCAIAFKVCILDLGSPALLLLRDALLGFRQHPSPPVFPHGLRLLPPRSHRLIERDALILLRYTVRCDRRHADVHHMLERAEDRVSVARQVARHSLVKLSRGRVLRRPLV